MAVRMDGLMRKELDLHLAKSMFWTDSTAVLKYIGNEKNRFRTFVANRLEEIRKLSTGSQWRHVPTSLNPADHASRGQKVSAFMKNQAWISGPDFLIHSSDNWPKSPECLTDLSAADPEIKKNPTINALGAEEKLDVMQKLIEHYSSWMHLKKAVAWILKVKTRLRCMVKRNGKQEAISVPTDTHKDKKNQKNSHVNS